MDADQRLKAGMTHHRAGRLEEAASVYLRVAENDPGHAEARHLLGAVFIEAGDYARARSHLERALALDPGLAEAHNSLGIARKELGQIEAATESFEAAIALKTDFAEALSNLGGALLMRGESEAAFEACRRALDANPDLAHGRNNLGNALKALGRLDEATKAFLGAIEIDPGLVEARVNLSEALRETGDFEGAAAAAGRAAELAPREPRTWNALGNARLAGGEAEAARDAYTEALALDPGYAAAHNNLGNALMELDEQAAAGDSYRRALAIRPDYADALANLGAAAQAMGDIEDARANYDAALAAEPDHVDAIWNRALIDLLTGDLRGGFAGYERRWQLATFSRRPYPSPLWRGGDVAGKTVLIYSEQGYGDTIQFIRYAALLKEMGARVVCETHPPLAALLDACPAVDAAAVWGGDLGDIDCHVPILSLPHLCATTLQTVPAEVPYLVAPDRGLDTAMITAAPGLKVGIAWAGRATRRNRHRSCPLGELGAVATMPGVSVFSLQKGAEAAELKDIPWGAGVADLDPEIADFADLARAISALDLVISIDTAVAHLAGALGKPVWTMIPFAPDWRWLLGRDDSPWYPTMRLFRHQSPAEWTGVMARVAAALEEFRDGA